VDGKAFSFQDARLEYHPAEGYFSLDCERQESISLPNGSRREAATGMTIQLAGEMGSFVGLHEAKPAGALFYSSSSISSNSWTSTGGTQPSGARASVSSTTCTSRGWDSFKCSSSRVSKSSRSGSRGKGSRAISS
jgi:hypothetical protein